MHVPAYEKYPVRVSNEATIPQSSPAAAVANFALSAAANSVSLNDAPAVDVIAKAFPFGAVKFYVSFDIAITVIVPNF